MYIYIYVYRYIDVQGSMTRRYGFRVQEIYNQPLRILRLDVHMWFLPDSYNGSLVWCRLGSCGGDLGFMA